jgi:hypothetical protein
MKEEINWKPPLFRIFWDESEIKATESNVRMECY